MDVIGKTYTYDCNCYDAHPSPESRDACVVPEMLRRHGQSVTIIRELIDGKEYDREDGDPMFDGQFSDGIGQVWLYELKGT